MARRDRFMNTFAIEPGGARMRPLADWRALISFEPVLGQTDDSCIPSSRPPRGLPCSMKPHGTYLEIKTCH
jgi:hypothetical protein